MGSAIFASNLEVIVTKARGFAMILRTCTGHTRTTRRALRMALAIALGSGAWTNIQADTLPTGGHAPPTQVSPQKSELLPYPFGKVSASVQPRGEREVADRAATSRQLVKLLGLGQRGQAALAKSPAMIEPQLPMLARTTSSVPTLRASNAAVVTASATDEQQVGASVPALPTLPTLGTRPSQLQSKPETAQDTSLSESLLDIEIPTRVAIVKPVTLGPSVHTQTSQASTAPIKSTECAAGQCPSQANDVVGSIVQTCEPPLLVGAQSISPAQPQREVGPKQPTLVRSTKPVSLAVGGGDAQAISGPVSLNLNDSFDKPTANKAKSSGRGAELHLSSGSNDAEMKAHSQADKPKAPMQVRIEGEPAPLISGTGNHSGPFLRSAAPMPMMQSTAPHADQQNFASSLAAPNNNSKSTLQPVKAVLASRKTPVAAQGSLEDSTGIQSAGPLTVGLQESATLSTDYSIAELSVEHPHICQLLKTSDRSISVIGMRPGTTRIALISYDSQGERAVDVREVAVGESAPTEVNLPELIGEISQTVKRMYPKSDVQITAYQDYVLVRGYTNYESDAKKILSLVRKTSLAPVVDQLTTSGY